MKVIKIYGRDAPDWFGPYNIDLDIKEPYNMHLWLAVYMWMFMSYVLFFYRKRPITYNTIGSIIPR